MGRRFYGDCLIVLAAILIAAGSLLMARNLVVDSSTDAFIPQKAAVVAVNKKIEKQFGSMDSMVVGVLQTNKTTILTPTALSVIKNLSDTFSALDGIDSVRSLTNIDHLQGGSDGIEVVPLFQGDTPEELQGMEKRIEQGKEIYEGTLLSSDRTLASIILQPNTGLSGTDQNTLLRKVQNILATQPEEGLSFSLVGLPVVKNQINKSLVSDLAILGPVVGFLIILVLFLSFRRIAGVVLPLLSLLVSASLIMGIMALSHSTFTMATMLVPVLLLIVGSAYTIHVMSHFYEEVDTFSGMLSPEETDTIIKRVVHRNRLPIIMAGATTAAGFLAQLTSPLAPFRSFGYLSALGVILSQLSALYLLPSLLRLSYPKGIKAIHLKKSKSSSSFFTALETIARKGSRPIALISGLLLIGTILLLPTIKTGTNMLDFFKPNSKLVQDTNVFNEKMNGSNILTVMIKGDAPSSVLNPGFLSSLEAFTLSLEKNPLVGNVQTILPYLKQINAIYNLDTIPYQKKNQDQGTFDFFGGSSAPPISTPISSLPKETGKVQDPQTFYEIPTDPKKYGLETTADLQNLISQYLILYSGNLSGYINDALEPDATLIVIQLHPCDTKNLRIITKEITGFWQTNLSAGWTQETGGGEAISLALTDLVTRSQIYSLIGAILIVWLLVSLMFKSPLAGLLGIVPVAFALIGIFASMALLKIHLDIITSLLASLAIGIGVDYAIHLLAAFKRADTSRSLGDSLPDILGTTGRAIVINAASVSLGFSGLLFSHFIPIQQMGILFCISMLFASLSSLTVLPMLIIRTNPSFLTKQQTRSNP
ncbi:MMPL family transporter [uncultured Sphaerochaeta sp.]|uniref:efflux RND transporter permease subunit n=1 Tax=uncultured Sphaerochaeta sp. TaxID=886478 RepID=UPI002A0A9214|nr:MMPL family transporter [uncultured Sphaerochaeta sp.]